MPPPDKNTSVFLDGALPHVGDLSHAETRRGGEFFSRKEHKDHKAGGPTSVSATIDRPGWKRVTLGELVNNNTISMGRGNVISKESIASSPGEYPVFSSSATGDGIIGYYSKFMFDDERISWSIDGGGRFFYHPKSRYSVTNVSGWIKVNNPVEITTRFLYIALDAEWQKKHFDYQTKAHPSVIEKEYSISYPTLDEQNEISNAIDSIDTHIAALQSLIAKYEAIKKATVNLLLKPKAGWKRVKLGDVFEVKVGGDLDVPHYSPYKTIDCRYEIVSNSLTNHGHYGYTSLPNFPGDSITVTGRGNVGHAEYRQEPFDAIVRTVILSPNCAQVCSKFVAELINATDTFLIENTGVPQLTAPQIASTSITLPPLDEQKRIVEILDSLDGTISGLRSQLAKAQDIKRGMMAYFFG